MKKSFISVLAAILFLCATAVLILASCSSEGSHGIELQSEDDIAGLRVGTVAGSCYDIDLSTRTDISLSLFNTASDMLQALLNHQVDVIVDDETIFNSEIRRDNGIRIAFKGPKLFPTALTFRNDEAGIAETFNAVQRRMHEDGSMEQLKLFWLTDEYLEEKVHTHIPPEESGEPLRVASIVNMAPLAFMVEGEWFGLETDLVRQLAKELKRPLDIKLYEAASGMMALSSGQVDVLIGGLFITPERQESFIFADPYHSYRSAYFVIDTEAEGSGADFWQKIGKSLEKNLITENRWKYITAGLWETVKITLLSIIFGAILGAGICAMTRSSRKWIRSVAGFYNWLMAGIPMLVLLLILFYVVFARSGIDPTLVAVFAFAMNFASGASDVYNSSLDSVPLGQTEAGLALGFTRLQTFLRIVFPQALNRGIPLFQGQCISLLKGTSIVGYIAIQDLTRAGDLIRSRTFDAFVPLLVVTVIYFILAWLLGLLIRSAYPKKHVL